jgi:Domain of unknown function (DUF1905)
LDTEPPDDIEMELIEGSDALDANSERPRDPRPTGDMFSFVGELWHWRGPAPYHFVSVPPDAARAIRAVAAEITYGWGMIPAEVQIGSSIWTTALWPKDGGYVVPIKDRYRKAEGLDLGATVEVRLTIGR